MKSRITVAVLFLATVLMVIPSAAKEKPGTKKGLSKAAQGQPYILMNANNVTSWVHSDGFFNWLVQQSWNGEYPRASGVGTIFSEGVVFGGFVTDGLYSQSLRVTGDTYQAGMAPGAIHADGTVDDEEAASSRAFGVRPDMPASIQGDATKWPDLTVDAATFFQVPQASVSDGQKQQIATQYFADWNEWPAAKGAPWFVDTVKQLRTDAGYDPTNPHDIPGVPGASKTIWFVCNDQDAAITASAYGSPPLGIEEQMTLWAYASSTPLNNIVFKQVKLIYKGNPGAPANSQIDSMYVVQWSDPDNGDSGDDYAGSDSTLNLNYDWNSRTVDAKFAAVGLPAAAVGYVFLQGVAHYTGVSTDSAVVDFQWRHGYRYWHTRYDPVSGDTVPAPLTAACYFAAGSTISDPDIGPYDGTQQWFNLMRGDLPRPQYPAGVPFYSSSTYASSHGIVTNYILPGDPTTGEGWIDGYDIAAGDRRLVTTHGPFTMNKGDTAEVVVALVDGTGADNLSSVKVLKYNTTYAQFAFNNNFNLPAPPPSPKTSLSTLDGKVVLNWGSDPATVKAIESSNNNGFAFEGYNVYQLPSASAALSAGVRVATFDIVDNITVIVAPALDAKTGVIVTAPVQFGNDKGIQRTIEITQDYIKQQPLVNGQVYYYAVTAYSYDPQWNTPGSLFAAPFPSLESAPLVITAEPTAPSPGSRIFGAFGDTLVTTHDVASGAKSDGIVYPIVVQPDKLTGHTYSITFDTAGGKVTWSLTDKNTGNVLLSKQTAQTGNPSDFLSADGVMPVLIGAPNGFKDFEEVANANGPHASTYGAFAFNSSGFPDEVDANNPDASGGPTPDPAGGKWGIETGETGSGFSYSNFLSRVERNDDFTRTVPYDFELRFTAAGGEAFTAFTDSKMIHVPFELWNIGIGTPNDPSDDVRLIPWINDVNGDDVFNLDGVDHSISGGDNDPETDWIYWENPTDMTPGHSGYDAWVAAGDGTTGVGKEVMARMVLVNWNGGSVSATNFPNNVNEQLPAAGTVFRILTTKPNRIADSYTYTTTAPSYSVATAQADVNKINVFPNPYYGMNTSETNRLNKWVRFSHLPPGATIRIFNLAGILVNTLPTTDATSTFEDWNLRNSNGLPVASGIYIAYVDIPSLGKTKILKLAIVQEEQILPTY